MTVLEYDFHINRQSR